MPASPPLLSICIPTFQRADFLRATLARIAERAHAAGWAERLEICVSDNASADGTPDVIAAFQPAGIAVRRVRQQENVGFSRNLRAAAQLASGEYLLFQGDDDRLTDGAFGALDAALVERPAAAMFPTLPDQPLDPADWPAREERRWFAGGELLRKLGIFHLTFLGNFIVRRTDYLAADREPFAQSLYPHMAVLLSILRRERAWSEPMPLFEFDEERKNWNQPLLTAVDLTRVLTDEWLVPMRDTVLAAEVYRRTMRSIPRAFLNRTLGRADEPGNPYRDLALGNVLDCYRGSRALQSRALALWLAGRFFPTPLLHALLGEKPRKVHFPAPPGTDA